MRTMHGRALKTSLLASVTIAAITASAPASAANKAPPPAAPETWSWSGVYIGGHGGYGWARDPFSDPVFQFKNPATAPLTDANSKGGVAGFQGGINWQSGFWVGGVEIDLSFTGMKGSTSISTGNFAPPPISEVSTATQTDKFDWLGSARARLGYLPWPNVLLYGTAGPAWTRLVQTFEETDSSSDPARGSVTTILTQTSPTWRFGAVAGVGAEARLWDSNWLARVEYLHYDFGKSEVSSETGSLPFTSGRVTADVVRAGLGYKFGQDTVIGRTVGIPVKAPRMAATPWTWSGFYIGGHAGFGWGHDPFTEPFFFSQTFTLTGVDSNGFVGGFQAGGNWQTGAWVAGLELDLSGTGIKGSTSGAASFTGAATGANTVTVTDELELIGSARARVGYLVWPDVLLYGTGGLTWTRLVQTEDDATIFTSGGTSSVSSDTQVSWEFGWVAGLGIESRLWNSNWLARIEYLHYDFGDSGSSFDGPVVTFSSGHLTTDVIRGGLSYKFDWGPVAPAPAVTAMPLKARPAVAGFSWSGFYLGGHAGYGWGRDPSSESLIVSGNVTTIPSVTLDTGISSRGGVVGFQAGANRQLGSWVAGLEIDLSATGIKGSTTIQFPGSTEIRTDTDKFDTLASARARLGYLVWPDVLFYGTGGLAWTRLNQSSVTVDTSFASGSSTPSWEFGWVAGGGGETRLWDSNWLLRLEYLHYDFGESGTGIGISQFVNRPPTIGSIAETSTSGRLTTDVVRGGLSYKLN